MRSLRTSAAVLREPADQSVRARKARARRIRRPTRHAGSRFPSHSGCSVILPSYQICEDEDELAHIERLRQVSLIAGYKGPLPIFRPRKRRES